MFIFDKFILRRVKNRFIRRLLYLYISLLLDYEKIIQYINYSYYLTVVIIKILGKTAAEHKIIVVILFLL